MLKSNYLKRESVFNTENVEIVFNGWQNYLFYDENVLTTKM